MAYIKEIQQDGKTYYRVLHSYREGNKTRKKYLKQFSARSEAEDFLKRNPTRGNPCKEAPKRRGFFWRLIHGRRS